MSPKIAGLQLNISGLGIILYSPGAALHIKEREDYLSTNYTTATAVQGHIQAGTIVGFGTGTPGTFQLDFYDGSPANGELDAAEFRLRLGIKTDGTIVCRDLYDLMSWSKSPPRGREVSVAAGLYRLTLLSQAPRSGILGQGQLISIYLEQVDVFPRLATVGIPILGA